MNCFCINNHSSKPEKIKTKWKLWINLFFVKSLISFSYLNENKIKIYFLYTKIKYLAIIKHNYQQPPTAKAQEMNCNEIENVNRIIVVSL